MSVLWEGALFVAGNYLISDLMAHVCRMCQKSQAKCEVETFSLVHFLSYAASYQVFVATRLLGLTPDPACESPYPLETLAAYQLPESNHSH